MAMVDRYKKSGGFVQLLQVIETCGPKKQEQFMNIIKEETPVWHEAINQKMLSFDKILSWRPEALLEIVAQVNPLAFVTALKSLTPEKFNGFCEKLSLQERRKIETQYKELNPDSNQISSCVMKVVSESRNLFISGSLKYDKIDANLAIPENYESQLMDGIVSAALGTASESVSQAVSSSSLGALDFEQLKKKYVELNQQANALRKENALMKEKLERIKRIA